MSLRLSMSAPLLGTVAFAACAPVSENHPPVAAAVEDRPEAPAAKPVVPRVEPVPAAGPRFAGGTLSGIRFSGVSFDSRNHRLVVIDQPGGPGSRFADAAAAGRSRGALAAVNAGFFTPEGDPLGLVMSGGKRAGSWNGASSLGSGIWHDGGSGAPAISRRGTLDRDTALRTRELIQAGPLLIEGGKPVGGLDAEKSSARTFLLWDGGTRWWLGRSSPCTLRELARALAAGNPAGWPVAMALNLDGGRSSEFWMSRGISGGPINERPVWNRPVRNFLALVPR